MQNEHHFQSSGDAEGRLARQRPEEEKWAEFAHDLEMLGHQLSELSSHTAVLAITSSSASTHNIKRYATALMFGSKPPTSRSMNSGS